eukprot:gene9129-16252_t
MSFMLKTSSIQASGAARRAAPAPRNVSAAEIVVMPHGALYTLWNVENGSAKAWIANWKEKRTAGNRPAGAASWFPGADLPEHLDGTMPGDFGFDPLRLGVDSEKMMWYQQAELQNGRWAMMGVFGILFTELLGPTGIAGPAAATPWYEAGKYEYFASVQTLVGVQALLFAFVEARRYQDMQKPGSANVDPIFASNKLPDGNTPGYPGGIFDPLGYSKGNLAELKVKEIKNARLAMLAFAGFIVQLNVTGKGPLASLFSHVADPWNTTVWQNSAHIPL